MIYNFAFYYMIVTMIFYVLQMFIIHHRVKQFSPEKVDKMSAEEKEENKDTIDLFQSGSVQLHIISFFAALLWPLSVYGVFKSIMQGGVKS